MIDIVSFRQKIGYFNQNYCRTKSGKFYSHQAEHLVLQGVNYRYKLFISKLLLVHVLMIVLAPNLSMNNDWTVIRVKKWSVQDIQNIHPYLDKIFQDIQNMHPY